MNWRHNGKRLTPPWNRLTEIPPLELVLIVNVHLKINHVMFFIMYAMLLSIFAKNVPKAVPCVPGWLGPHRRGDLCDEQL